MNSPITLSPEEVLSALRSAGHSARRQDTRIMIGNSDQLDAETVQAIKDNRADILILLASEEKAATPAPSGWAPDEMAFFAAIREYNAAIDARPVVLAEKRQAKRKKQTAKAAETDTGGLLS